MQQSTIRPFSTMLFFGTFQQETKKTITTIVFSGFFVLVFGLVPKSTKYGMI
jgi:hypothetical protein